MTKSDKKYINKPFMLNLNDPEEYELYEWLKQQKARTFKRETKAFWMKKMRGEKDG